MSEPTPAPRVRRTERNRTQAAQNAPAMRAPYLAAPPAPPAAQAYGTPAARTPYRSAGTVTAGRVNRFSESAARVSLGTAFSPSSPATPLGGSAPTPVAAPRSPEKAALETAAPETAARTRTPLWQTMLCVLAAVCALVFAALYIGTTGRITALAQAREQEKLSYEALVNRHTVKYRDLIERISAEYGLRPAYVAAVILRESSYDPYAVSGVGARGLMQLMPDTAEWIAGKLDVENYTFDMMDDPETNITFGAWYLNYLGSARQFGGDPVLVACAYHAGQGNVRGWVDKYAGDDGVLSLSEIPMSDTRSYAGKVYSAYAIYWQHVYPD